MGHGIGLSPTSHAGMFVSSPDIAIWAQQSPTAGSSTQTAEQSAPQFAQVERGTSATFAQIRGATVAPTIPITPPTLHQHTEHGETADDNEDPFADPLFPVLYPEGDASSIYSAVVDDQLVVSYEET